MSVAAHSICPNYNRCNKYLEFTLKLDAYEERDRRKNAVIAAQARSGIASFSGSRTRRFRRRTTSRSGGSGRSSSPESSASGRSRRTASAYARRSSR